MTREHMEGTHTPLNAPSALRPAKTKCVGGLTEANVSIQAGSEQARSLPIT